MRKKKKRRDCPPGPCPGPLTLTLIPGLREAVIRFWPFHSRRRVQQLEFFVHGLGGWEIPVCGDPVVLGDREKSSRHRNACLDPPGPWRLVMGPREASGDCCSMCTFVPAQRSRWNTGASSGAHGEYMVGTCRTHAPRISPEVRGRCRTYITRRSAVRVESRRTLLRAWDAYLAR